MATMTEQVSKLLDFSQKLDITLLENIVGCMYTGTGDQQRAAQEVLTTLKEHPDAWTRVDTILEFSNNQQTKYFALQILEQLIKTRWKVLPRNQCEGIKKYIVALIIKTSSDPATMEREKTYLNKLNIILVQVLKREWPKNWESFVGEIVGASRTNESLCQNNMVILKLLSEEVFDFSAGNMTQMKAKHLKDTMCSEFAQIFELCQFVLGSSQNVALVNATLDTLLRFLNWIPLGYIFETDLIDTLIFKFFNVPMFRNITLQCLTEVAAVTVPNYDAAFAGLFSKTMAQLVQMLPIHTNIKEAYATGQDQEQNFIQNLALFLCTFLKDHALLVEKNGSNEDLLKALHYLVMISEVEEIEIFKICLEYWNGLAASLYRENPFGQLQIVGLFSLSPTSRPDGNTISPRRQFYAPVISQMRYIMISRMAKPEEVLVVENENGEVVREFMKDTDAISLYKSMRETLVYLTHLDCVDTERIMTEKLHNQVNGNEWSWKNLNTLCWAIGSISGAMHEEDEKRFLVTAIKDLLGLCEQKKGKDNKAIIASNIMYVVGQYPRFLRAHWKFLKTVVNKLFEFMHETHDGVQDMACDTFIKIAMKCRRYFVQVQVGEAMPFIEEILNSMATIISDLQPQQVHTFYEAVGIMISAQVNSKIQEQLIDKYMMLPNLIWDDCISQASKDVEILKEPEFVKQLGNILKTNARACKSLGHQYVVQLGRIYLDMLNIYNVMSANITDAIATNGDSVTKQPLIKNMRVIKKETLRLISDWISRSSDNAMVLENFIPPLLETVLADYSKTMHPSAREPEVLSAMATIIDKLQSDITPAVSKILDAVFEATLTMINKDFEQFPEHRTNFYLLLQAINNHCFVSFLSIPAPQFKLVLDSIFWAFKHTMRNVADTGLLILYKLLQNVQQHKQAAQSFYVSYFTDILQHVFSVATDTSHTASLLMHAQILSYMFKLVESDRIEVLLSAPGAPPDGEVTDKNVAYVRDFVASLLKTAFPHLADPQIALTVQGMFNLNHDLTAFKDHLRDFLVQIREFTGEDISDLYLEEREQALRVAQEEKREVQKTVPGILNPHEITDDMQD
ncbi:exportin-1 [Myzus persicae]|uniref:exportin-1 n=1 Tax=Myzus persicae TaxID=13164 RepID=UPI000B938374|nr:exportin-1 [Myzus persicae]XP_022175203.1 exportin-1 [Myzus persicae]XP_022175204.1 exportin-1 [Myzus persicae]XP_022175205.1 exportin-1 [Myzus persicae]